MEHGRVQNTFANRTASFRAGSQLASATLRAVRVYSYSNVILFKEQELEELLVQVSASSPLHEETSICPFYFFHDTPKYCTYVSTKDS
ncbi:unnamed protein product [Protopolystoma xenopodis]|uniref:Uncharacterized protein n=1 Tax=Protopolystoma xenopodis TaxID=117903 RepID=A0A3S5AM95_9PLAT|nr:unnamed protein product [Protopolystoma xenopodis]